MPPGTRTPTPVVIDIWATPTKMAPGVVIASQYDKERTLTGIVSGSASGSEGDSGTQEASDFMSAHFKW